MTKPDVVKGGYRIFRAVTVADEAVLAGGDIRKDNGDIVVPVNDESRLNPADIQKVIGIHCNFLD
jgi:hypothetical protein